MVIRNVCQYPGVLSITDFVLLLQVQEEQRRLRQRRLLGAEFPGAARQQPGLQPLQRRGLLGKMKKIVNYDLSDRVRDTFLASDKKIYNAN